MVSPTLAWGGFGIPTPRTYGCAGVVGRGAKWCGDAVGRPWGGRGEAGGRFGEVFVGRPVGRFGEAHPPHVPPMHHSPPRMGSRRTLWGGRGEVWGGPPSEGGAGGPYGEARGEVWGGPPSDGQSAARASVTASPSTFTHPTDTSSDLA